MSILKSVQKKKYLGAELRRLEDFRFLTGKAVYISNIALPKMLRGAFLRSTVAHARIKNVDTSSADKLPGVFAVCTGSNLKGILGQVPSGIKYSFANYPKYYPIAFHEVNFVGEIVAVVLADNENVAVDALESISVDYEELPVISDPEKGLNDSCPCVHEEFESNLAYDIKEKFGDVEKAFDTKNVFSYKLLNQRVSPSPIETRVVIASYDQSTDELTVWSATQWPHIVRTYLSRAIHHPESKIRVIAPDLGGGFGQKSNFYPEEIIVPILAKVTGRPVCWHETRNENLVGSAHARDYIQNVRVAVEENGKIRGLCVDLVADIGAYFHFFTPAFPISAAMSIPGYYKIPSYEVRVRSVFTNKKTVDSYRGVIASEACYCMERTMDLISRDLCLDPTVVRFRNYVNPSEYPFTTVTNTINPIGDHPQSLRKILELLKYDELRVVQNRLRQEGRYIGIGFSSYWELSGFGSPTIAEAFGMEIGTFESATVRIHPTGSISVATGSSSHGQGHETAFAQIAAELFQIDPKLISVQHGDTRNTPFGVGTWASRSAPVGGTAIEQACLKVKEKATWIASHLLKSKSADLIYDDGHFYDINSPNKRLSLEEIAKEAYFGARLPTGMEPGLEAVSYFYPTEETFASGTHAAVVEVDTETGNVTLLRYISVDDFGEIINPLLVQGQVHGGVMQGLGQALYEEMVYNKEGQPITSSFLDYLIPTALNPFNGEASKFETYFYKTRTTANPIGVKGMGESGAIAAPAALANAVDDALRPFRTSLYGMPLSPERVWAQVVERA
jgi:carbon-monoxide dehydrogenase large subunit